MEATRVIQFAGMIFCLVIIISEMCYCYPPSYYSSEEENTEHGVRKILDEWEREGFIRSVMPSRSSMSNTRNGVSGSINIGNGHEIMTRKSPRSGSNSNLRLRYGKRSNLPQFELTGLSGVADDAKTRGKSGNWKVDNELEIVKKHAKSR